MVCYSHVTNVHPLTDLKTLLITYNALIQCKRCVNNYKYNINACA